MLLVVSLVIIDGNTIRTAVYARRTEIEIMKLVGATDWFVRWPFLLEGIFGGVLGAVLAGLVVLGVYRLVVGLTSGALFAIPFDGLFTLVVVAGLFVGGAIIGAIGSYLEGASLPRRLMAIESDGHAMRARGRATAAGSGHRHTRASRALCHRRGRGGDHRDDHAGAGPAARHRGRHHRQDRRRQLRAGGGLAAMAQLRAQLAAAANQEAALEKAIAGLNAQITQTQGQVADAKKQLGVIEAQLGDAQTNLVNTQTHLVFERHQLGLEVVVMYKAQNASNDFTNFLNSGDFNSLWQHVLDVHRLGESEQQAHRHHHQRRADGAGRRQPHLRAEDAAGTAAQHPQRDRGPAERCADDASAGATAAGGSAGE